MIQEKDLNDYQMIILDALKESVGEAGLFKPIHLIYILIFQSSHDLAFKGSDHSLKIRKAYLELTRKQEAEVLQVFSSWVLSLENQMCLELNNTEAETLSSVLGLADQISTSAEGEKAQPFFDREKLDEIKSLQQKIEQQRREFFIDESPF